MLTQTSPVIAGRSCGIPIEATPQAKMVFNNLEAQAKSNYWAHMIVSGINALCSGQMSVDNVFVKQQGRTTGAQGQEFYVVLPGCTASMRKLATGRYKLLHMTADENYFEQQISSKRPGLYTVNRNNDRWNADFIDNGSITNKENRFVVITERSASPPSQSLDESYNYFKDNPLTTSFVLESNTGFDMHYTPGDKKIGGMVNLKQAANAQTDSDLHESALLLAESMSKASNVEGVQWISERGGAGVLTQALRILADQNITLQKHSVFLCHPTTRQSVLVDLSLKVGLGQPRQISKNSILRPGELIGGLGFGGGYVTAYHRLKKDQNYDGYKFTADVTKESISLKSAAGTAATVGTAVGLTAGGASLSAVAVFAGAVVGIAGLGKVLTEAYLPRLYYKMTGKF